MHKMQMEMAEKEATLQKTKTIELSTKRGLSQNTADQGFARGEQRRFNFTSIHQIEVGRMKSPCNVIFSEDEEAEQEIGEDSNASSFIDENCSVDNNSKRFVS